MFEDLLKNECLDVNYRDAWGKAVMHYLIGDAGRMNLTNVLLNHPNIDINLANLETSGEFYSWPPLHIAIKSNNV